jgi:hypothetical protein
MTKNESVDAASMHPIVIQSFADEQSAFDWMEQQIDDPCVDNERFAFMDDKSAMDLYETFRSNGCCGFFDEEIEVNGRRAMIGCNYGH